MLTDDTRYWISQPAWNSVTDEDLRRIYAENFRAIDEPGMNHKANVSLLLVEVERLRKHIQADYDQYHAHHPYAHELRKKYPWLATVEAAGKGK